MLQYFPVDRVCSRVCYTGKFQFPFYERKNREKTAQTCLEEHTKSIISRLNMCFILSAHLWCVPEHLTLRKQVLSEITGVRRWSGGMCEWQCGCLSKLLRPCASVLSFRSCRARPKRSLNLWIRSFQQLWPFSYFTFCASLKPFCKWCRM